MTKGSDTRTVILEHAMATASRIGFDGLSIGRLAREVGLSKSGLYAHFGSKEDLQRSVLSAGVDQFVATVIAPALRVARGEPRVRSLFEGWLLWPERSDLPGGCLFLALSHELDDQPGPLRDQFVEYQKDWLETIAQAARIAVQEGHFRDDLDAEQFAFEFQSIALSFHYFGRLIRDELALQRAQTMFEELLSRAGA